MLYNQPYGISDTNAAYINGDPSIGRAGSIPPAASIEYPQREIVAVIADAGLTPTNADLAQLAKAIQTSKLLYGVDTGAVNQLIVTLTPAPNALTPGLTVHVKIAHTNTGPSTLTVNGFVAPIQLVSGQPVPSGRLLLNMLAQFMYDGSVWQLMGDPSSALSRAVDYYVDASLGVDTNDGLSPTTPFKTLQRAADEVIKFNLNGYGITIHMAAGLYAQTTLHQINGSGNVVIQGNEATPGNVTIQAATGPALNVFGSWYYLRGCKLQSLAQDTVNGLPGSGIAMFANSTFVTYNVEFGTCAQGSHITCWGGEVDLRENTKISAGAQAFIDVERAGLVTTVGNAPFCSLTITAAAAFSSAFVVAASAGIAAPYFPAGITGAGFVTGQRYNATGNAVIDSLGHGVNYLPGTVAGATATGGQYL